MFALDTVFLGTNLFKFLEGGWLPVSVAGLLVFMMLSWITGRNRLLKARWSSSTPLADFLATLNNTHTHRVPGTAIFMVPHSDIAPIALLHKLKHNTVLHERVVAQQSSPLLLAPFIYMHRTMQIATEYFKIPFGHAIEIGGHITV